jgi:hypothetical protein
MVSRAAPSHRLALNRARNQQAIQRAQGNYENLPEPSTKVARRWIIVQNDINYELLMDTDEET